MKKRVALISNFFLNLYNFRKELIEALLEKYEVTLLVPMEKEDYERFEDLKSKGCKLIETPLNRRGMNPFADIKVIRNYTRILKALKPDIAITYTIKPNIYAGIACSRLKIPYISNITGLGTAFQKNGLLRFISVRLYRMGLKNARKVFFQNRTSQKVCESFGIAVGKEAFVPGSGINLSRFEYNDYSNSNENEFLYIARIMKEKGADEFFYAARKMKEKYEKVSFGVLGFNEENYDELIKEYSEKKIINFYGWVDNVSDYMEKAGCIVNPSYHEGMSNVCLEGAAMGRVLIASDIPGCQETIDDNVTGFLIEKGSGEALLEAMEKYYKLPIEKKTQMGFAGRKKMEKEFDRRLVVEAYLREVENEIGEK